LAGESLKIILQILSILFPCLPIDPGCAFPLEVKVFLSKPINMIDMVPQ
jgi:hypothetical protein